MASILIERLSNTMKLSSSSADTSFVAVDWGTSGFRLWGVALDRTVTATFDGPFGMSQLKRSDFGNVLEDCLEKLGIGPDVPVVICGMAGAAQGWCEAPYLEVPTRLDQLGASAIKVPGIDRNVRILPGVKQLSPANVMRGEETQIAGLLHHQPEFHGTVCLPGTHTKWVHVKDGTIEKFETCMTGEQFAFFSKSSVLSHSMIDDGWCDTAFLDAVQSALRDPLSVPRLLFSIRAKMLIADQLAAEARAHLSGLLIGQELMATKQYWENQAISLIGATHLCDLYIQALQAVGVRGSALDTTEMTLTGLCAAYGLPRKN